ncbi:MAG: YciI family protein [Gemmatimonadaceae bacterium]
MKTYFCKLIPPRATFLQDMSEDERQLMQQHGAYWRGCMDRGTAVVFGVVADPAGAFGVGIIEVADEAEAKALTAEDPVIRSGRGFRYDLQVMPMGVVKRELR